MTRDRPEAELTEDALKAARATFDAWLDRWGYLADGLPGEWEVDALLLALFRDLQGPQTERHKVVAEFMLETNKVFDGRV